MAIESQNVAIDGQPILVDGSGVTQPVSGTVTANVGTTGGLALDATLTGGTQKTKIVDAGGTNLATVSAAGAVKVDGSAVTQPVSGTVTANAGTGNFTVVQATGTNLHTVVDSGSITTTQPTSSSATITQSTVTTSNSTILAANAGRKKAVIFIATANTLIKYGATASAASFTYKVTSSNTTIEVDIWIGQIDAITTGGSSLVTVTELV